MEYGLFGVIELLVLGLPLLFPLTRKFKPGQSQLQEASHDNYDKEYCHVNSS